MTLDHERVCEGISRGQEDVLNVGSSLSGIGGPRLSTSVYPSFLAEMEYKQLPQAPAATGEP